jgi:hypothetical protein
MRPPLFRCCLGRNHPGGKGRNRSCFNNLLRLKLWFHRKIACRQIRGAILLPRPESVPISGVLPALALRLAAAQRLTPPEGAVLGRQLPPFGSRLELFFAGYEKHAERQEVAARRGRFLECVRENQVRNRLFAGGRRIRTIGPARERDGRGEGDSRPTIVVSRDPCLNDPIQLIGPASPFGNSRDPVVRAGPMVRIQFPPAGSPLRTCRKFAERQPA